MIDDCTFQGVADLRITRILYFASCRTYNINISEEVHSVKYAVLIDFGKISPIWGGGQDSNRNAAAPHIYLEILIPTLLPITAVPDKPLFGWLGRKTVV